MKKQKKYQPRGRKIEEGSLYDIKQLLQGQCLQKDHLIEYLHLLQDHYQQISLPHMMALANELNMSMAEVYEVASFYHHFDIVEDNTVKPKITVRVCNSISCELFGSDQLIKNLQHSLGAQVNLQKVPCVGRCANAPVAVVGQNPIELATVSKIQTALNNNQLNDQLPETVTLLDEYISSGGYKTWKSCSDGTIEPYHVMTQLESSNLRGLGGAGFPVGKKWRIVNEQAAPRMMAVNIDEGEPGTFKDRYYLERDPHRFLEGMLIATQVVGIESTIIYIRDEYTALRKMLQQQIDLLTQHFPNQVPDISIRRGAGSYICGEESAMIESIEGKRGMPRLRPPFVAEVGLYGRPTLEHNMESLYWIRDVIEKGADWFSSNGRHGRNGFRSFSVSGRVKKPGVHVAPAGITMNELIDEYCGGMLEGHTFNAYFPGGASGGILPASLADIPLDFDTLQEYGCFIGSAAIIVLSDRDSIRRSALNAMKFFAEESCGQCTPCRVGTQKASMLMQQPNWDVQLLQELSQLMQDTSICGLGQAAPNPVLSAIRYFPEEIKEGEGK
mgnify:CR=1 FL=1